ncbi:hypothetical protein A3A40_02485 [Candidatus Kaiserbacteria bacterium RIFCSPLOWO2_01_FULL_54_20]|uniref:Glycosyltransferase subfamily 4-like N-terminal domain-containing protein n=1 Tax=Candidatus Kaiserbacteria bacterium RIFCSPLOWO2_01_FULL_54_20 TaxID=1798513 RepID=A0A1F6EJQ1_9BACT|nr:MAG: hypothetical protein A3A40_02485 [Candidatus Kaiserbacteria bacterium RIFCSPLOWO2_01_FULL_54_20]
MNVLQIGSDVSIFQSHSPAHARIGAYGRMFGDLHMIVFSLKKQRLPRTRIGLETNVYPTASVSRFLYIIDAIRIARIIPDIDVVSVQDPFEIGIAGWLIARMRKIPLHVQVHTDFLSDGYSKHALLNKIRVKIASFILPRAARVRVVSEKIRSGIEERYHLPIPVTMLPIFTDVARFRDKETDPALAHRFRHFSKKLLVVSRLESEKNVSAAIDALKAAPQDACLIILGEGSERMRLEKLARKNDLSSRVFFEMGDPAAYYKLADLLLVPSFYEGYGLVIIEALAAGKPVLSTDVGIAREAGAIVTTEEKFADALADWFKNGPRTGELRNYPYAKVEEYVHAYCNDIMACTNGKKLP